MLLLVVPGWVIRANVWPVKLQRPHWKVMWDNLKWFIPWTCEFNWSNLLICVSHTVSSLTQSANLSQTSLQIKIWFYKQNLNFIFFKYYFMKLVFFILKITFIGLLDCGSCFITSVKGLYLGSQNCSAHSFLANINKTGGIIRNYQITPLM